MATTIRSLQCSHEGCENPAVCSYQSEDSDIQYLVCSAHLEAVKWSNAWTPNVAVTKFKQGIKTWGSVEIPLEYEPYAGELKPSALFPFGKWTQEAYEDFFNAMPGIGRANFEKLPSLQNAAWATTVTKLAHKVIAHMKAQGWKAPDKTVHDAVSKSHNIVDSLPHDRKWKDNENRIAWRGHVLVMLLQGRDQLEVAKEMRALWDAAVDEGRPVVAFGSYLDIYERFMKAGGENPDRGDMVKAIRKVEDLCRPEIQDAIAKIYKLAGDGPDDVNIADALDAIEGELQRWRFYRPQILDLGGEDKDKGLVSNAILVIENVMNRDAEMFVLYTALLKDYEDVRTRLMSLVDAMGSTNNVARCWNGMSNDVELQHKDAARWLAKTRTVQAYREMLLLQSESMLKVFEKIRRERRDQDIVWGADRTLDNMLWNTILIEEVGEVSRAILKKDRQNLHDELVQVAAVAVAWLENWERENNG